MQQLDGHSITKAINERGNSACFPASAGQLAKESRQANLNRVDPFLLQCHQIFPDRSTREAGEKKEIIQRHRFFFLFYYKLKSWKKTPLRMMTLYLGMEWTLETMSLGFLP